MANQRPSKLKITVVDTAFDPRNAPASTDERAVIFKKVGDRDFYKVWLYLDGPDVPFVQAVTYELHPSFRQRIHTVSRTAANQDCTLIIWTWGTFEVKATVRTKSNGVAELTHMLSYDRDFKSDTRYTLALE